MNIYEIIVLFLLTPILVISGFTFTEGLLFFTGLNTHSRPMNLRRKKGLKILGSVIMSYLGWLLFTYLIHLIDTHHYDQQYMIHQAVKEEIIEEQLIKKLIKDQMKN